MSFLKQKLIWLVILYDIYFPKVLGLRHENLAVF
jgi:hypothetical protein